MPTFLRVMTSSVVYSSRSLATPVEQCILTSERTYGNEWSLLSCLGVMVWCCVVMWNKNLWKEVFSELHAPRDEKAPVAPYPLCTHTLDSPVQATGAPLDNLE